MAAQFNNLTGVRRTDRRERRSKEKNTPRGTQALPYASYVFDVQGMDTAPDAADIQLALEQIKGVRARVVYPSHTAWISAPPEISLEKITQVFEANNIRATLTESSLDRYHHDPRARRRIASTVDPKAREAGFFITHPQVPHPEQDYLASSLATITPLRFIVALVCGVPAIVFTVLEVCPALAAVLTTPVVIWCAWPFHRGLLAGSRGGLTALDGANTLALTLAYTWSLGALWVDGTLYFDVACLTAIVLVGSRLLTQLRRSTLPEQLEALRVDPHHPVEVTRRGHSGVIRMALQEVNVGDDIMVPAGDIVPVDGHIIGGTCTISDDVIGSGLSGTVQVGSMVYAGMRTCGGPIKVRVMRTGHTTRAASTSRWVATAANRQNIASRRTTRTAAALIPATACLSASAFAAWWMLGGDLTRAFSVGLAVLGVVAPGSLALSAALATRQGIETAARHGIMVADANSLRQLTAVNTVAFNRLGTLTLIEDTTLQTLTAAKGEDPDEVLRVAAALMMDYSDVAAKAIVRAARSAEGPFITASRTEIAEDGAYTGSVEQGEARVWRPHRVSEVTDAALARAVSSGGTAFVVTWKGRDRGVITLRDRIRPEGQDAIAELDKLNVRSVMVSRDAYPVARRFADRLGISYVLAGIRPDRKAHALRTLRARGATVAMVGDENVIETLAGADIGMLFGPTESLGFARERDGVDVVILRREVTAVPQLLRLARRVRGLINSNLVIAGVYNTTALVLAMAGLIPPLIAPVLMALVSMVVEGRIFGIRRL